MPKLKPIQEDMQGHIDMEWQILRSYSLIMKETVEQLNASLVGLTTEIDRLNQLSIDDNERINLTFIDIRGKNIETNTELNEQSNISVTRNNRSTNRTNKVNFHDNQLKVTTNNLQNLSATVDISKILKVNNVVKTTGKREYKSLFVTLYINSFIGISLKIVPHNQKSN